MREQLKNVVIMSAMRDGLTYKENRRRDELLKSMLSEVNLSYKSVVGSWEGVQEESILIVFNNDDELEMLRGFASNFDQDAILVSDSNRDSHLITRDGGRIDIGKLQQVNEEVALKEQGYTYDPVNQSYWVCR